MYHTISKRQLQTNRTDVLNCSMAVCLYRSTVCVATNVTPLSLLISAFETTLTRNFEPPNIVNPQHRYSKNTVNYLFFHLFINQQRIH